MISEKEIREKINKLKNIYLNYGLDYTLASQRLEITSKIDAFKWVIEDDSDDSWMFNLQDNNQ